MVHRYGLLSLNKEDNSHTAVMNKPWGHYIKWNKPLFHVTWGTRQKEEWWLPGKGEIFNGYRMGTHLQDEEFLRLAVQQCKGTWQYGAIHN